MTRKSGRRGLSTYCPACSTEIFFRKLPRRGHYITCHECESLLEVVRLAPLTLNWAFEEPFDGEFDVPSNFNYDDRNQKFEEVYDFAEVGDDWEGDWDDDWDDYDEDNLR